MKVRKHAYRTVKPLNDMYGFSVCLFWRLFGFVLNEVMSSKYVFILISNCSVLKILSWYLPANKERHKVSALHSELIRKLLVEQQLQRVLI